MTLMKSLLLGSAASLVVVAAAQAADLPTRKGAPAVEYVKVCHITVDGTPITGFVLPGSDTCFKISGLITAQYTAGSIANTYAPATSSTLKMTGTDAQNSVGLYTRGRVVFEAVSNTAYGPLYSMIQAQMEYGAGFDSTPITSPVALNNKAEINSAYLEWAGITAGKHGSFFDFIGGSINTWDDFISPDHTGGPVPLLAYTAQFGGGFSATLSAELPEYGNPTTVAGYNTYMLAGSTTFNGQELGARAPDFVAAFDLKQGWGAAHLAGVLHNYRALAMNQTSGVGTTATFIPQGAKVDAWGWGIIGGLTFNLPSLGAGADVKVQGVYTDGAYAYSGLTSPGAFNTSGVALMGPAADTYYDGKSASWKTVTAWSIAGGADIPFGSTFKVSPEISYGAANINLPASSMISSSWDEWVGGGTLEWTPVKNLVFDLDLLYVDGTQAKPGFYAGTGAMAWRSGFDGFNAKLRIERDF